MHSSSRELLASLGVYGYVCPNTNVLCVVLVVFAEAQKAQMTDDNKPKPQAGKIRNICESLFSLTHPCRHGRVCDLFCLNGPIRSCGESEDPFEMMKN